MAIRELMNTEFEQGGKHVSIGIDEKGRLYVNGERVVTEQPLRLNGWLNAAVIAGGVGALAQGIFAGLTYFCR